MSMLFEKKNSILTGDFYFISFIFFTSDGSEDDGNDYLDDINLIRSMEMDPCSTSANNELR